MAMLYNGCDCKARPYPSVTRERAIWQCDECLTIHQIVDMKWVVVHESPWVLEALDEADVY